MEKKYQATLSLNDVLLITSALLALKDKDEKNMDCFKKYHVLSDELKSILEKEIKDCDDLFERLWSLV